LYNVYSLSAESVSRTVRRTAPKKYLISWTLILEREELETISRHPESLEHGLNFVRSMVKRSGLQLYRIVPTEEVTHFARLDPGKVPASARPTGSAILEAGSLEEARTIVDGWVDGLGYGGGSVPVRNYLEYEIKLLMDLGHGEGE
jgi:hypothetical protein